MMIEDCPHSQPRKHHHHTSKQVWIHMKALSTHGQDQSMQAEEEKTFQSDQDPVPKDPRLYHSTNLS